MMSISNNNSDFNSLINTFKKHFQGEDNIFICRSPGRLNLIGEHTDYNGFPVLPFAIPEAVNIAFTPQENGRITLRNVSDEFPPIEFHADTNIPASPAGSWDNYPKASVQDLTCFLKHKGTGNLKGFRGVVDSSIPPSGGLSSSSALVVASALCFLKANEIQMDSVELASRLAEAEKYVGTRGGGMDQAACICGREKMALRIDFQPLDPVPIPFPGEYSILACHSLVHADKAGTARKAFNFRVQDCTSGVKILQKSFSWKEGKYLRDFASRFGTSETLHALEKETGREERIFSRCRYVLQEGLRVEKATEALKQHDMKTLGVLMNQSHEEARDLYEISCPELDTLVEIGRRNGALGARLTGAGFGGFAIMLGKKADLPQLRDEVDKAFYLKKKPGEDPGKFRFIFNPSDGAGIKEVSA